MEDNYLQKVRENTNNRFKQCDENGIYFAHQPIYGFQKGHCETRFLRKCIQNYDIVELLSYVDFNSFIDVGSAEGYKTFLIRELLEKKVAASDVSEEACRRAQEIFNVENAKPASIHELPFQDEEFDVVLCSETLEHVPDLPKALDELFRIAKKAVMVTVPYESHTDLSEIHKDPPFAHVNNFNLNSFDYLQPRYSVLKKRIVSSFSLHMPLFLVKAERKIPGKSIKSKIAVGAYNLCVPIFRKIFGEAMIAFLIHLDALICQILPENYNNMVFVIFKDKNSLQEKPFKQISAKDILRCTVPFYYINKKGDENIISQ